MADDIVEEISPVHPSWCGVTQERFPCMKKCYDTGSISAEKSYQNVCPYCSVWTSLPDGGSLAVATIFECSLHGYGRRIKEMQK